MTTTSTRRQLKLAILVSVTGKKVLFVIPYPLGEAPSQRFRFEQYFDALRAHSVEYNVQSFLTKHNWRIFYGKGKILQKTLALLSGFWRRTVGLVDAWRADYVFIHREASPIGPPLFEWIIAQVLRKRIIYDFDDAIWLTDKRESVINRLIKNRGKISTICKWSYRISCGNQYLADYARKYNRKVTVNPTTIDADRVHNPDIVESRQHHDGTIVIGWTGSHSTLKYLELLEATLQNIEVTNPTVSFVVIADRPPKLKLSRLSFVPWNENSEVADLMKLDIGLMPLPDDEWSKGKCGFKILQYMSLRIPSVSSAVGVNPEIVTQGENGFLCATQEEWLQYVQLLIENASLRKKFGDAGRQTVLERYSVTSNTSRFLSLFE